MSVFLCLLLAGNLAAQENISQKTDSIVAEGKMLYRSEMASWQGNDIFLSRYEFRDNIGGYFSYVKGDTAVCIFFSKADDPFVIGSISFDTTYQQTSARVDISERYLTEAESELLNLKKAAIAEIDSDTLFKQYENTSLNLVPLIDGNERKVYVLTGPQEQGVVIFGNDYLMTFDKENNLLSKRQLHNNIIPIYLDAAEEKEVNATMHSHLPETGELITATDICTLMMYGKFTTWKTHNVVSSEYMNIWDVQKNELNVVPMDVIRKIYKDQEKRDRKKNKKRNRR